jgi:formylglycine-generating enzyme required for sulfatase activity
VADPRESEWLYTCTNGGTTSYAYGDAYVAGRCVDASYGLADAGGVDDCHGTTVPFDDVFDLAGSVAEWTAACVAGECSLRGGAYADGASPCSAGGSTQMQRTAPQIGFRCCADPG